MSKQRHGAITPCSPRHRPRGVSDRWPKREALRPDEKRSVVHKGPLNTETDALRHVRFAGRPAIAGSRPWQRGKLSSPPQAPAARACERPGEFVSWVFARAGLDAENYRGEPLARRLGACLRALRAGSEAQAREAMEQRPDLLGAAISSLLIGVTDFFRDPPVFDALATKVLPAFQPSPIRGLRVWSAGCSNGAELYSVAILLAKAGLLEGSFLLGSDCRPDAVEHARKAVYKTANLRRIEPAERRRHFEQAGGAWRPIERLRRHVHWKVADLGRGVEPGPWDLILWRNVAIYLRSHAAAAAWQGLAGALAPGGVLVVGKAERAPVELPLIAVRRCIYRAPGSILVRGPLPESTTPEGPRAPETCI